MHESRAMAAVATGILLAFTAPQRTEAQQRQAVRTNADSLGGVNSCTGVTLVLLSARERLLDSTRALVLDVEPLSPAKGRLVNGDTIVAVNGAWSGWTAQKGWNVSLGDTNDLVVRGDGGIRHVSLVVGAYVALQDDRVVIVAKSEPNAGHAPAILTRRACRPLRNQ